MSKGLTNLNLTCHRDAARGEDLERGLRTLQFVRDAGMKLGFVAETEMEGNF